MSFRLRTKKLIWSGLIGASAMLIISIAAGYFFYTKSQERELRLKEQYRAELETLNETVRQNEEGIALTTDVKRGQLITEDMVEKVTLPPAAKSSDTLELMSVISNFHYAKTDLQANTVLVSSMFYEEEHLEDDVREGEYAFIELPTKLKVDDYVDLRIQFPNGDDYVFLSKKKVKDTTGLTLWVDVDEGEQLTMSSAIVDAFIEEAKIYAMPYVDAPMQAASNVTYPVKSNVLELINDSPNIVNRAKLRLETQNRERLENYLREMEDEQREAIRQKEREIKNTKKQDDKERELIEMNQSTIYEEDLINDSLGEGENE